MCDQQNLRSACAYTQSDQSLCQPLEYSLIVKLRTEHHLEFLSLKLKGAAQFRLCLHMSKCHIVGNHMSWLICTSIPENCINLNKQCRPWWNLSFCDISSGSSMFAKVSMPIAAKVVCFSRLLKYLRNLYVKQCSSSLFWVHAVCFYT